MNAIPTLRLFGGFALSDASGETVRLTLRKTEALIAFLAVCPSQSQQREALASLLWSESRSEEHTYELQSLMRISYDVSCLKKQNTTNHNRLTHLISQNKY